MGQWLDARIAEGRLTAKMLYDHFGFDDVIGVRLYGTRALAGPYCMVALTLPPTHEFKLEKPANELSWAECYDLSTRIRKFVPFMSITWVSAEAIRRIGKPAAVKEALNTALVHISQMYTCNMIIRDSFELPRNMMPNGVIAANIPHIVITKNSARICDILCAGDIIARVARTRFMEVLHTELPMYEWDKNAGMATDRHLELIEQYGKSYYHF